MIELQAGGTTLRLLAQRALFVPEHGLLLVADAHIGKAVSFRKLGVPVPGGTTSETLARLDEAIEVCAARHVIFLGDLLHSARALAPQTLAAVLASALTSLAVGRLQRYARSGFKRLPTEQLEPALLRLTT